MASGKRNRREKKSFSKTLMAHVLILLCDEHWKEERGVRWGGKKEVFQLYSRL